MTHRTRRRTFGTVLALPLTLALGVGVAFAQASGSEVDRPSGSPDASFTVAADSQQVPPEDGERGNPDASGDYDLELFLDQDVVCFDISVSGVSGDWESPAPTANHIHQGNVGLTGPAIVAFPNPEMGSGGDLTTSGCLEEPILDDQDASLSDIDSNPAGFYVDIHTSQFPRGDARGNLQGTRSDGGDDTGAQVEDDDQADGQDESQDDDQVGGQASDTGDAMPSPGAGPEAGFGGAAAGDDSRTVALTGAALLLALAGAATASQLAGRRTAPQRHDG